MRKNLLLVPTVVEVAKQLLNAVATTEQYSAILALVVVKKKQVAQVAADRDKSQELYKTDVWSVREQAISNEIIQPPALDAEVQVNDKVEHAGLVEVKVR